MKRAMPVLDLSREGSATYEVPGCCQNCDWSGVVHITKGEEAPGKMLGVNRARCERCGCRQVVAS